MRKRSTSLVTRVSAGFVVAVIALGVNEAAPATETCIEQPSRQPAEGAHWYYRSDRANHRKCWFLGDAGTRLPETPSAQPVPVPPPIFPSLSSSSFGGAATREPRINQANPTKMLQVDDIVQKGQRSFPEERPEPRDPPQIKQASRDFLFQKFLQWDEAVRLTGGRSLSQSP